MIAKGSDRAFAIGTWQLFPAMNLLRGEGREVRLEPRHADLLAFLAERAGEVVGTEEILSEVWRGLVVTDQSLYQAVAKLRKALGDTAAQASYIETVPKRGYRLIAEVSPLAPDPSGPPLTRTNDPDRIGRWRKRLIWLLLGAALTGLVLALLPDPQNPQSQSIRERANHHQLLVQPFASLSSEPSDALVAAGFAIELADMLASMDGLQVFGPVSSRAMASGTASAARADAGQAGADIIVSGSLRRLSSQLRVSATLTMADSGLQLWSRIFERDDGDVFTLQQRVAAEVAQALQGQFGLASARLPRSPAPDNRSAYDDFLLGTYYRSNRSAASLERARGFFQHALDLDQGFTLARRDLGTTYLLLSFYGDLPLQAALDRARPLFGQCLAERPDDAELLGGIGLSHALQGAYGLAEDYLRRAVAQSPNYAEGWMWLGFSLRRQGRLRLALDAFEHAHGLEPLMVTAATNRANALAWSGRPQEGRALLEGLTRRIRDHSQLLRILSDIALEAGDLVEAHRWANAALAINRTDALSKVNLAMILSYLEQDEAARALLADIPAASQSGRMVQLYLDRMTLVTTGLTPELAGRLQDAQLMDSPSLPEIEWRLANARIGLLAYFSADPDQARDRLTRSLAGRSDPVERTEYDLFLCTSLADLEQRRPAQTDAVRWLPRCERELSEVREQGWRSLAVGYVEARLTMLRGAREASLGQLQELVARGFRNRRLLQQDPVFAALRDEPAFGQLLATMEEGIRDAWSRIVTEKCPSADAPGCS